MGDSSSKSSRSNPADYESYSLGAMVSWSSIACSPVASSPLGRLLVGGRSLAVFFREDVMQAAYRFISDVASSGSEEFFSRASVSFFRMKFVALMGSESSVGSPISMFTFAFMPGVMCF
jgi:hypothetical protein